MTYEPGAIGVTIGLGFGALSYVLVRLKERRERKRRSARAMLVNVHDLDHARKNRKRT